MPRNKKGGVPSSVAQPSLFAELKQRRVYRAAATYIAVALGTVSLAGTALPAFHAPKWMLQAIIGLSAVGFPCAVVWSWYFDIKDRRIERTVELAGSEKATRLRAFVVGLAAAALAFIALFAYLFFPRQETAFDSKTLGVLVLRISGDDSAHSLQRELVSSLNTRLAGRVKTSNVAVSPSHFEISESDGLEKASEKALEIGRRLHATMVIWGETIQKRKFHPRLTLVDGSSLIDSMARQGIKAQTLMSGLPEQFADRPIALLEIIQAMQCLEEENHKDATTHFDAALSGGGIAEDEMSGIQNLAAYAYLSRALHGDERTECLDRAIELFQSAANSPYEKCPEKASSWINVSKCYSFKTTGEREEIRQHRLAAVNKAIQLAWECDARFTRLNATLDRARLFLEGRNPSKAIAELEMVVAELVEAEAPEERYVLSSAYFGLAESYLALEPVVAKNLDKALQAVEKMRSIELDMKGPNDEAALEMLVGRIHLERMQNADDEAGHAALAAFKKAQHLALEEKSAVMYAAACYEIGSFYLRNSKDDADSDKAIIELEECLRNRSSASYPEEWAKAAVNLAASHLRHDGDKSAHRVTAIKLLNDVVTNPNTAISNAVRALAHFNLGVARIASSEGDERETAAALENLKWAYEHCDGSNKEMFKTYLDDTRRRLKASDHKKRK